MKKFLHVGCGPKSKANTTSGFNTPDWEEVRLDIDGTVSPDIIGTMTDMQGVADESMDAIFSSHNIEHLYAHEVGVALKEFMRVLRPDGFLVVTCPDLQSVCALVAEDKLTAEACRADAGVITPLDILYGYRPYLAMGNLYMAHKCGFTKNVLTATLLDNGFAHVASARCPAPSYSLWALATKEKMDDETLRALALEHFPK